MKFVVTRTSGYEVSPCEEATVETIVRVEEYIWHTPEEFNQALGYGRLPKWHERGANHRVNDNGHIERDNGTIDVWMIEINTLDDLLKFHEKYGDIIIGKYLCNKSYQHIEIYDDYRE